ncbi:hypothetical protein EZV62_003907 [Acer yangbiense]|uniref:DUF668 domain-containing protein n=1 Tax=Acer yangbiense TaxID=1000413 RepID=A0A5C7IJZ9_9ROSI|nr:hypothetical protein EZV62_003907 [Acer yangbiense]
MLTALFLDRMCPKEEAERFNRCTSMKSNVRAQMRLYPPVTLQVSSINRRWLGVGVDPLILSCFDEDFPNSNLLLRLRKIASAEPEKIPQRLGSSHPTSLPPNMRDSLYNGLPTNVKTAICSQLQSIDAKEELSAFQAKAEMEKTLQWLVPLAANTIKAHQGFGWVGEWANSGHEFGKSIATNINPARLSVGLGGNENMPVLSSPPFSTWSVSEQPRPAVFSCVSTATRDDEQLSIAEHQPEPEPNQNQPLSGFTQPFSSLNQPFLDVNNQPFGRVGNQQDLVTTTLLLTVLPHSF